ncbi:TPR domain-containing glycosyltransferase [Desulfofundulus salinus]|uniref:Glycosyltransferase n=1 Tax=Desulfofundulus salinus TaxID=2419843 RepID=A0A494WXD9_9FIRM|nr:TPR domain-containing glycosyltransferase [Desulfofundulus salinum]RKO65545.1 glycosyltransferase [Desulfofundulus salinum]
MESRISLCMIVKDEEQNIRRCLQSVAGTVDEIIVVDTGSTDGTCQIAREFGALVHSFPWNDNFSDARNASLELATGDWILFLDADEELAGESREVLRRLANEKNVEGYFIKIINYVGNEGWGETCPDLVFRLFKNRKDYRFRGAIHEQIADVILERNSQARYQIAEDLVILHYGYLDRQIKAKDKKNRNLALLSQELNRNPDNRHLRYHYGVELYRAERFDEAAAELVRAANGIDPNTIYLPKLLRYIVLAYHAARKPEQALEIVQLGLDLFPDYADLYYYGGLISYEQKDYGRAYEFFQRALSMPEQPAHYAPFGGTRGFRSLYQMGQLAEVFLNHEEAMRYYILSLRDNPHFTPALESITRLLKPQEDPVYAKKCLEQLCEFCTPQANLLMGQILFRQSAYKLALEYLERGMDQQEAAPEILLWKAICLIQLRRYLEALRILEGFDPGHRLYPLAKLNKILCFWFQGKRRKVLPLVEELFALGLSQDTGAVVSLLRNYPGRRRGPGVTLGDEGMSLLLDILMRALDLGEKERAESLLDGLSRECLSKNARAVGQLFYRYGHLKTAEYYLGLYLEANPECPETLFTLAEIKERQNACIEAGELYRRALALDPAEPRYYVSLIRLYEKMRREILREAIDKYPELPVLRRLFEEANQEI